MKCNKCGGNRTAEHCNLCDLFASGETLAGSEPSAWPMVSEALAVHPKRAQEANERNKRHGINVTYDRNGRAHIPDRNERRKLLRLERLHDNQGGYGD